jgi:GNAT superfamily N-acetyltransferase
MALEIVEIPPERLEEYAQVPMNFEVRSIFAVEPLAGGLGGLRLVEVPVPNPYVKDYTTEESPVDWPAKFDVRTWGFFLARQGELIAGAAAVAFVTTGVFVFEARRDLAVLWDIRVRPACRGAGIPLFRHAAAWSRQRGCTQMKVETQNVNVPACRFYQRMGCELGEIRRYGYAGVPAVSAEVMLNWYLDLTRI